MSKIKLIGIAPSSEKYELGSFVEFVLWASSQAELQLDIETDMTPYWTTKTVITVQFGSVDQPEKVRWVLQWSELNADQRAFVKSLCEDKTKIKLAHNAAFEVIVLRSVGIDCNNMYCTMLCEKILTGGVENADYALADLYVKYFHEQLDKTEQTTFGDNILTENKVVYAAEDVNRLDEIRTIQMREIVAWKLEEVLKLENTALLGFCDITFNGMLLDTEKWAANEAIAQPVVDAALAKLNAWLKHETFNSKALELKYVSESDRVLINFNSHVQKSMLFKLIFPDLEGATLVILKKFMRDFGPALNVDELNILISLQGKDYGPITQTLIRDHRQFLIENGLLVPAGVATINWNSVDQALPICKVVHPRLKDLSEDSTSKTSHQIFRDLSEYKDALKLTGTFGHSFIEKHVNPDGKVRPNCNQIVSTGRGSQYKPNMQQIPAKESPLEVVQPWLDANPGKVYNDFTTRYRNAFVCEPDEVFVDSDFTGQELAIIAHISKDPVWFRAIQKGEDLHSVCAELVFGRKWLDARASDCAYYKTGNTTVGTNSADLQIAKKKCKCPGHKTLRNAVKTVNFGLALKIQTPCIAA